MKTFGRIVLLATCLMALIYVAEASDKPDYKSGTVTSVTPHTDATYNHPSATEAPLPPSHNTFDVVISSDGTDYHCRLQTMHQNISWAEGNTVKFRIANKVLYLLDVNDKEKPCDLQEQAPAK